MIVGMQKLFARDFVAAVGNDLVGVHVGLRAAAGLPNDQREVVVQGTGNHLVAGAADHVQTAVVQLAEFMVGNCRGLLQNAEGVGDFARHDLAADFEVLEAALRLRAPVAIRGHLHFTHGIPLNAIIHALASLMPSSRAS